MKKNTLLLLFLLVFIPAVNSFSATLMKIDRIELNEQIKLYFIFDTTPAFSANNSGTRLDITFTNCDIPNILSLPEPNEQIVRYTTRTRGDDFIVSLFFRYIPDDFEINRESPSEISLDVTYGSIYSNSVKTLSRRLQGLERAKNTELRNVSPLTTSIYRNNWEGFFTEFTPDITIKFPTELTWPPFPLVNFLAPKYETNSTLLSPELLQAGTKGMWLELKLALPDIIQGATELETKQMLAFIYAETLARSGQYEDSYTQLYLLNDKFPNSQLSFLCQYLMLLLQAKHVEPFVPAAQMPALSQRFANNPLAPYILVNETELALATKDYQKMNRLLLSDSLGFPYELEKVIAYRQADYWHALQQPIKAAAAYRIASENDLQPPPPYSQNGYCSSLFMQYKFDEAQSCYRDLKSRTTDPQNLSMVSYMSGLAKSLSEPGTDARHHSTRFRVISNTFTDEEGGQRGLIKSLDYQGTYTEQKDDKINIAKQYLNLARKSLYRDISEEAYFKAALTYYLAGEIKPSVTTLQEQLTTIRTGKMNRTAQALLIQTLPSEINDLFQQERYTDIIVLIQKNREIMLRGWLDKTTNLQVAQSYYLLDLYKEAFGLYSYLVEVERLTTKESTPIYTALAHSAYMLGKFSQVIDYTNQLEHLHPNAQDTDDIALFKAKALFATDQEGKALTVLPETEEAKRFAITIYYYQKKFGNVVNLYEVFPPKSPKETFYYAESLYQIGQDDKAYPLFAEIDENTPHWAQATYRRSEFLRLSNRTDQALPLLEKIIAKQPESMWSTLAQKDVESIQLEQG